MKVLVIVPDYPNKRKVNFQFVHDRVKEYIKEFDVDVFCYNNSKNKDYTYESVKVCSGNEKELLRKVNSGKYDKFVFHFLSDKSSKFILKHLKNKETYIWLHGTDCISWKRRLCAINFSKNSVYNPYMLIKALAFILINKVRLNRIKKINSKCENNTFIFVSDWLKKTTEKDINVKFEKYEVINNYINNFKFNYINKSDKDRFNILSITNYSTNFYAGDILQEIICEFSKRKEFSSFSFTLYGQGKLFKKQTSKLKSFPNVTIINKFVKSDIIKKLHNENGLFLYPKRGDTQGVSRCEAMASGLVSIASDVEAISEFSPKSTTYLVNSVNAFVKALIYIYNNPNDFINKSKNASDYIREKCGYENTIRKEIILLKEEK